MSTTSPKWTDFKFNPELLGKRMETKGVNHGMALSVYCENHAKNAGLLNVKAGGTNSDHCSLNS
jgi:hypothetical protein